MARRMKQRALDGYVRPGRRGNSRIGRHLGAPTPVCSKRWPCEPVPRSAACSRSQIPTARIGMNIGSETGCPQRHFASASGRGGSASRAEAPKTQRVNLRRTTASVCQYAVVLRHSGFSHLTSGTCVEELHKRAAFRRDPPRVNAAKNSPFSGGHFRSHRRQHLHRLPAVIDRWRSVLASRGGALRLLTRLHPRDRHGRYVRI